jgi:hypothetical protein
MVNKEKTHEMYLVDNVMSGLCLLAYKKRLTSFDHLSHIVPIDAEGKELLSELYMLEEMNGEQNERVRQLLKLMFDRYGNEISMEKIKEAKGIPTTGLIHEWWKTKTFDKSWTNATGSRV